LLYVSSGNRIAAQAAGRQLQELIETNSNGGLRPYRSASLALAYAVTGDKAKAVATAKALEKASDAVLAVNFPYTMAQIGGLTSDKEMALTQLAIAAQTPSSLTYGELRFDPLWDPLRSDPRFEKIGASLAPKQ